MPQCLSGDPSLSWHWKPSMIDPPWIGCFPFLIVLEELALKTCWLAGGKWENLYSVTLEILALWGETEFRWNVLLNQGSIHLNGPEKITKIWDKGNIPLCKVIKILRTGKFSFVGFGNLAPVVQKADNHYPTDNAIAFPHTYPLDSDLSCG